MRAGKMCTSAVLLATIVVLGTVLTGQSPPPKRPLLVTADSAGHVTAWRSGANGYEKVWESKPRLVDAAVKSTGTTFSGAPAVLAVADCDGDGTKEIVVMDMFGITVYGAKPTYLAFDQVAESQALAVGDADGDGSPEIVTQRVFANDSNPARQITVLKLTATGLTTVGQQTKLAQYGVAIAVGDVDGDKKNEIVSGGGDGITILKRGEGGKWDPVATLPVMSGGAGSLAVADVDKDNKNEIICGNSGVAGKVSVYKYRKIGDRVMWPVLWQSHALLTEGMTQGKNTGRPYCTVSDVIAADVDGDGQEEIVAASLEYGKLGDQELMGSGRVHVFKFDGQSDFTLDGVSDRTKGLYSAGISAGDLDGDGISEIAFYGRAICKRTAGGKAYAMTPAACPTCNSSAVGELGELREPAAAARVVPVAWTVPGSNWPGQIVEGQTVDVALTLRSVWAETRNVSFKLASADQRLEASATTSGTATIPAGGTATLSGIQLKGRKAGFAQLNIDIATADGYRQSIPVHMMVGSPLPTYKPTTESAVAEALAKARDDNQRVLVIWGANADKTSQAFLESTVKNGELSHELLYEYQVVRADVYSSQRAASKYGAVVKHGALPHLTVLTADGKVLLNEPIASAKPVQPILARNAPPPPSDVKKVVETLKKFEAPAQDAKQMVQAALDRAKTESKTVFIWFSAPW